MARPPARRRSAPVAPDYAGLADFRFLIRQFLRTRETAARAAGVEPQQYQVLLQIKGLTGRRPATVGALADRLQISQHAVVQLVNRLARRKMVRRRRDDPDARFVVIELLPRGETILRRLALQSLAELRVEGRALVAALRRLLAASDRPPQPARSGRRRRT